MYTAYWTMRTLIFENKNNISQTCQLTVFCLAGSWPEENNPV